MEGKEDRGETGNIFFCYPLWLFRSHLIVVPRFQWGRPVLVRAWSCITTVQLLERLFPLPTRVLPWSYRSEHWYKVTILSILKNVAGKRNNSPLSELSSLNLSPLYATQEIWSQVSGMTKKGGAGSDRKAIAVQKMAYFTATIEQTSVKASTSAVVMLPTQMRQTSLCLLQANNRSRNILSRETQKWNSIVQSSANLQFPGLENFVTFVAHHLSQLACSILATWEWQFSRAPCRVIPQPS